MLNKLAILVLLAIWLPVYGQQKGGEARSNQGSGDSAKSPTLPSPRIVTCEIQQDGTTVQCNWPTDNPPSYLRRLISAENLPNLLLVFVGMLGVIAAIYTLRTIGRQADILERQAKLTEAGMTQWVELHSWESEPMPDSGELAVSFQVSNPTNLLLTTERGEITFENPTAKTTFIFIYRPAPLAPNNPRKFSLSIPLNPEGMQALQTGATIGFSVFGEIVFRSVMKQRVPQRFDGIVTCNLQETKFEAVVCLGNTLSSSDQATT